MGHLGGIINQKGRKSIRFSDYEFNYPAKKRTMFKSGCKYIIFSKKLK